MLYGNQVKEVSLKHVQGKAARDTLSAIIEWTGNKIYTAKKRWIFELLQNAIDTATERKNENLKIEIDRSEGNITFKHNAGCFKQEEIAAVFYGGSTKPFERDSEYLGRFGTGFLVSYVLGRKVLIKSFFLDPFQNVFTCAPIAIDRTGTTEQEISDAIDNCFIQLNKAVQAEPQVEYWSEFTYTINDERGISAADEGIDILQKSLSLIFAFNHLVKSITINGISYRSEYSKNDVIESVKVNDTTFYYIRENEISVGLLVKNAEIFLLDGIPRIFLGMPLVETADLIKIPFIINSRKLAPTERRNALDSNQKINEEILISATSLYKSFLNSIFSIPGLQAKHNCLRVTELPQNLQEQNPLWKIFNVNLKEKFIEILNEINIVKTNQGFLPFNQVYFPSNPAAVVESNLLTEFYTLVRQIKSNIPAPEDNPAWIDLIEHSKELFSVDNRLYDIHSLKNEISAFIMAGGTFPKLSKVGEEFNIDSPRKFLLEFYTYTNKLYEKGVIHSDFCNNLLLDQSGLIGSISENQWKLHLENEQTSIDEELKNIVTNIGWNIRNELLDNEFRGFTIIKDFVRDTISLEKIMQTVCSPSYKIKNKIDQWTVEALAWVSLFSWHIIREINPPDDFPMITKNNEVETIDRKFIIPFSLTGIDEKFEDIYPDKRILNLKYFKKDDFSYIEKLKQHRYIITTLPNYIPLVTIKGEKLKSILIGSISDISNIDHKLEDKSSSISKIPFWSEVIGRISDDTDRAKLFFRFVFEYLAENDKSWKSIIQVKCICSRNSHTVMPSLWLAGLKSDKWVPVKFTNDDGTEEIERRQASKESIVKLFSPEEFEKLINQKRNTAMDLLPHLGFDGLDLKIKIQSIETGRSEQTLREEIKVLADINQRFPDLAELVGNDPQRVADALSELKDQRLRDRLKNENKKIGENVELIIRQIVRRHGLNVKNIHKGADMQIWSEDDSEDNWGSGAIELEVEDCCYYLESKFTSGSSVHISPAQSDSSRDYKERYFVLVVKAIPGLRDKLKIDMDEYDENEELQNTIIQNSRLIQNIFERLGEQPNVNEVEIDLNGYWLKQLLWQNNENVLEWLKRVIPKTIETPE